MPKLTKVEFHFRLENGTNLDYDSKLYFYITDPRLGGGINQRIAESNPYYEGGDVAGKVEYSNMIIDIPAEYEYLKECFICATIVAAQTGRGRDTWEFSYYADLYFDNSMKALLRGSSNRIGTANNYPSFFGDSLRTLSPLTPV